MDQTTRKRVLIALVAVSFVSSAALIGRYFLAPQPGTETTAEEQADLGAVGVDAFDPSSLPPQGDMSDQEYMLMLYRLREEADKTDIEPGSAQKAIIQP